MLNARATARSTRRSPTSTAPSLVSQRAMGGSVVEFASKELKAKKIAYINHDDAYGAWNLEGARFQAKDNGVTLCPSR